MRVLIVDPDWFFVARAREHLESRGHHVATESDPGVVPARCQRWQPDVVLLSAELAPCCEGGLLGQLADLQPRPAVVLTASLDRFDKAWRAWQKGGDEVLFKPLLHPSELHVAILTAIENSLSPPRQRVSGARAASA